jgi:hypothetical protein
LVELETYWTLDDMSDAHEALDISEALEEEARKKAAAEAEKPK